MAGESRSRQPLVINDFRPGLASEDGPGSLPPGAATEALNTMPSPSGALQVRPTIRQLDNLGFAHRPDVSHSLFGTNAHGVHGTTNIAMTAFGATSFPSAYADFARAANADMNAAGSTHGANRVWDSDSGGRSLNFPLCPAAFVTLSGQTVFINNRCFGRLGMATDAAGNLLPFLHRIVFPAEIGRDLTGCIAVVHHGRMFVAGNNSYPTRLRWSWVGEPCPEPTFIGDDNWPAQFANAWPSTNWMPVDANGSTNDPISGLASFGNTLWVFTTGAVYQIAGADWDEGSDIVLQQVPGAPGCISPRTVWTNDAGIFYVSVTGPKRVDRSRYDDISAQTRRSFDARALEHSHAVLTPERYLVTLPSADTVAEVHNAFDLGNATANFPSWQPDPPDVTDPPVRQILALLTPGTQQYGIEGVLYEFMRWQVNTTTADTGIAPSALITPTTVSPRRHCVMPFSTTVMLRFWVRRPTTGTSWSGPEALTVTVGWLFENDYGNDDLGIGFPLGGQTHTVVVGGNLHGDWQKVEMTFSMDWTYPKPPPEAMAMYLRLNFVNWQVGAHVDLDRFEFWPVLEPIDEFRVTSPIDTGTTYPHTLPPLESDNHVSYDRTFVYDIASQGWSRWSLGNEIEEDQPVNYSRPKPHTQDRFNYVTGGGTGLPLSGIPTWEDVITAAEPLAWWRFVEDEEPTPGFGNFADWSGNGHDIGGDAIDAFGVPGQIDDGISVTGTALEGTGPLNPPQLTVEMWIKVQSWPAVGAQSFLGKGADSTADMWQWIISSDGSFYATFSGGSVSSVTHAVGDPAYMPLGAWTHLVLTHDGTTAKMYVNGILIASNDCAHVTGSSGNVMLLANEAGGSFSYYTACDIDEVVIYDRALTPIEISAHVGAVASLPVVPAFATAVAADAPISWWRFEETSGNFVDSVGGRTLIAHTIPAYAQPTPQGTGARFTPASSSWGSYAGGSVSALSPTQLSAECWINVHSYPSISLGGFIVGAFQWSLWLNHTGTLTFSVSTGSTAVPGLFPLNTWTHIVVTHDGTTGHVYLDGVLVATDTHTYTGGGGTVFAVGADPNDIGTSHVDADIDEIVVYDHVLTSTQVNSHLATTEGTPVTVAGGYYTLEHRRSQGDKVYDPEAEEPTVVTEPTPWLWTSGSLTPANVPHHELQLLDSHINLSTVGPNPDHGPIEVASQWNGTTPNPPTVTSVTPATPVDGFTTEQIRSGYLGRGQYGQVRLEGNATGEIFIHAVDLEAEVDPRP